MTRLVLRRPRRTAMTQVVLIRPGATVYDEEGRVQGVLDIPLSDRGQAEVVRLADRLATTPFAALYCGPGESVLRTAEAVGRNIGIRPQEDRRPPQTSTRGSGRGCNWRRSRGATSSSSASGRTTPGPSAPRRARPSRTRWNGSRPH